MARAGQQTAAPEKRSPRVALSAYDQALLRSTQVNIVPEPLLLSSKRPPLLSGVGASSTQSSSLANFRRFHHSYNAPPAATTPRTTHELEAEPVAAPPTPLERRLAAASFVKEELERRSPPLSPHPPLALLTRRPLSSPLDASEAPSPHRSPIAASPRTHLSEPSLSAPATPRSLPGERPDAHATLRRRPYGDSGSKDLVYPDAALRAICANDAEHRRLEQQAGIGRDGW
ncbi:hypothetical protein AB1Y20_005408 [Prymnesium parvum]|uniref:Uncharacterized protein n=1 Tax=Prymnesium parvum TaxID=97485 RepID=A0AB34J5P3_PRYPA